MSLSKEAKQFKVIIEARDHHNQTCPLGPAIEAHLSPYDIFDLEWEEGDDIGGLMLVSNSDVQPDRLRILCAGDKENSPPPGSRKKGLPQPKVIEVPDDPGIIIGDTRLIPAYASGHAHPSQ